MIKKTDVVLHSLTVVLNTSSGELQQSFELAGMTVAVSIILAVSLIVNRHVTEFRHTLLAQFKHNLLS